MQIGIQIIVADAKPVGDWYPQKNFIGSRLLCQLLVNAIEARKIRVESDPEYKGDLNNCIILIDVDDPVGALSAVKKELEKCKLWDEASIDLGWFDEREASWRITAFGPPIVPRFGHASAFEGASPGFLREFVSCINYL